MRWMVPNGTDQVHVTWQLATIVCALFVLPLTGLLAIDPGHLGDVFRFAAGVVFVLTVALCVVAVRSRLAGVSDRKARRALLTQLGNGLTIIVAAVALSFVSYAFGASTAFGPELFLVPTGLYGVGLVMIGKAMAPEDMPHR